MDAMDVMDVVDVYVSYDTQPNWQNNMLLDT